MQKINWVNWFLGILSALIISALIGLVTLGKDIVTTLVKHGVRLEALEVTLNKELENLDERLKYLEHERR